MSRAESLRKYNNSEKGKATQLRYRRTTKGKALSRRAKLMHYYQMTTKEYDALLEGQEGCCAICKKHYTEFDRRLDIDHDHLTNDVRGLLCNPCNLHLGVWEAGNIKYNDEWSEKCKIYLKGKV